MADLKTRLYVFSDDSMLGREAGTIGNVKATDYLAAEVAKMGLRPAGDSGTYLQTLGADLQTSGAELGPYPLRNVVAILPGSDPVLRHQYVMLGAHSDHLGVWLAGSRDHDSVRVYNHVVRPRGVESLNNVPTAEQVAEIATTLATLRRSNPPRQDSIYNGADDDGSGSVALLEIAQALKAMTVKPKRSIVFAWHTGEEINVLGSTWLAAHPPVPLDSIVAYINMDMLGRGGPSDRVGGSPDYLRVRGSRCASVELGDLITAVNEQSKRGLRIHYSDKSFGRSDERVYAAQGIPVAAFNTDKHPDYHLVTDEPQYIDYGHLARVTTFLKDFAVRVANLDHRPRVDKPGAGSSNACPNGLSAEDSWAPVSPPRPPGA